MPPTVFWPVDVKHSGYCYGWVSPAICIIGILEVDSVEQAQLMVKTFCRSHHWDYYARSCGSELVVVGKCTFDGASRTLAFLDLTLSTQTDYNLIFYTRHDSRTLRFYSLDAPRLDSTNAAAIEDGSAYLLSLQHDLTVPKRTQDTSIIQDTIINQFNAAKTLDQAIHGNKGTAFSLSEYSKSTGFSTSLRSGSCVLNVLCTVPVLPFIPSPVWKDVSVTIQQIDIRAEQMDFLSTEVGFLHQRSSTPITVYATRYTNFFNTVWLILNDLTLGVALGTFICENHLVLTRMLYHSFQTFLVVWVKWTLHWLNSWPVGLKLNTELSGYYSTSFVGVVTGWEGLLSRGTPYLPTVIYTIGICSCGGISFAISLVLDLLAFMTFHIFLCYTISGAVYQRMLKTFRSLWNLFRGKRYNILRNRTDSWEYDLDQLLLGTILFTLLAFLFPTVLVYYSLFALMRLVILVLRASLETLLTLINHFPLFALMLHVKDPWRLPGGVYFARAKVDGQAATALEIKNQPVSLSSIFFQYSQLRSRLAAHYNPLRLLHCVLSGDYLSAIPRYSMRYNKMSRRPPGI